MVLQTEDWPLSKNKALHEPLAAPAALWTWSSTQKLALFGRPCCIVTQPLSQEEAKVDYNQSRAWEERLPWDPTITVIYCLWFLLAAEPQVHSRGTTLKMAGFLNSYKTSSFQTSKISWKDLLLPTLLQVFPETLRGRGHITDRSDAVFTLYLLSLHILSQSGDWQHPEL